MFRTSFRYENSKEDAFYSCTAVDALLGEYAKEYYEILLKEAKIFFSACVIRMMRFLPVL